MELPTSKVVAKPKGALAPVATPEVVAMVTEGQGMIQCTDQVSHFTLNYQASNMSLFVDSAFPSLSDFNVTALKWTDLDQNVVYQITSTRTVNTQHGQSVILSLQKADGLSCSAWACGMLSKELLQNPMIMVSSRLFVLVTGNEQG